MKNEIEEIVKRCMSKIEVRPFNANGEKDGNWNYIHSADAAQAFYEIRKLLGFVD